MGAKKRVCLVGSGNWGSALAKVVGENVRRFPDLFIEDVSMWVFEEMVDGRQLTEIINTDHENVKYLKGIKLPDNVKAIPDILAAAVDADILVFVIPHQFLKQACSSLVGKLKKGAVGISAVKGFADAPQGGVQLVSDYIWNLLNLPTSVLMGANIASEVAGGQFCETTIGCHDPDLGQTFRLLFQSPTFKVRVVPDVSTVEICGALKNVVACGAGFAAGMGCGSNTKAAVIRIGMKEMIKYSVRFSKERQKFPGNPKLDVFFESCGIADLITTCCAGRNFQVSEEFVKTGKSLQELEDEVLGGQKLQGPATAASLHQYLVAKGVQDQFPFFTTVQYICTGQRKPEAFMDMLRNHPVHEDPDNYTELN